jgi:hypothetical protein
MAVLVAVSAARVSMLLRLRSRVGLRRRSLWTRLRRGPVLLLRLRTILRARLRLRLRTILYPLLRLCLWTILHPLLRLCLWPILHPLLRLGLRTIFHPRLRLRTVFYARLRLCAVLEARPSSIGLRLPAVFEPGVPTVRLRLRLPTIFDARIACIWLRLPTIFVTRRGSIRLRLHRPILDAGRFVVGLRPCAVRATFVHVRAVGLAIPSACGARRFRNARRRSNPARVREAVLC